MAEFPPLAHVALTVRDLAVSTPWYEALFDAEPVIDEDSDPDLHHTVYMVGNGTLVGLHQHGKPAPDEEFSEFRVGLDHVASAVPTAQSSKSGRVASTSSASSTLTSRMRHTARV